MTGRRPACSEPTTGFRFTSHTSPGRSGSLIRRATRHSLLRPIRPVRRRNPPIPLDRLQLCVVCPHAFPEPGVLCLVKHPRECGVHREMLLVCEQLEPVACLHGHLDGSHLSHTLCIPKVLSSEMARISLSACRQVLSDAPDVQDIEPIDVRDLPITRGCDWSACRNSSTCRLFKHSSGSSAIEPIYGQLRCAGRPERIREPLPCLGGHREHGTRAVGGVAHQDQIFSCVAARAHVTAPWERRGAPSVFSRTATDSAPVTADRRGGEASAPGCRSVSNWLICVLLPS
jgi:hypothetical protein